MQEEYLRIRIGDGACIGVSSSISEEKQSSLEEGEVVVDVLERTGSYAMAFSALYGTTGVRG